MSEVILKEESYVVTGILMDVHRELGPGFLEIVYKDALEWELQQRNIPYEREKEFNVVYKGKILPHRFYADFVVFDAMILEVKAQDALPEIFKAQLLNYLKVSGCRLGILANFGLESLNYKRFVL